MGKTKKSKVKSDDYEEKETDIMSMYSHIRHKDKDTGPKEPKNASFPLWDEEEKKFIWQQVEVSIAMLTMLDEVAVNICDHATNFPSKVTDVEINFNVATGEISFTNNGPGIPVYEIWIQKDSKSGKLTPIKVENMDPPITQEQRELHANEIYWNPEVIATYPLAGTNLRKRADHRTGGTNGIGLKCTTYQSRIFKITTVDEHRKVKYSQTYEGRQDHLEVHKPELKYYDRDGNKWDPSKHSSFTRITFIPEYTLFGGEEYDKDKHGFIVMEYLRMRAYQMKVCTGMKITFMKKPIVCAGLSEYALLHTETPRNDHERELPKVAHCIMDYNGPPEEANKYQWEIAVIANLNSDTRHVTLVNSIYPYEGGTHIDYLLDILVQQLMEFLRKDMNKSQEEMKDINKGGSLTKLVKSQLCIFGICPINGPSFSGQIKSYIMTNKKEFSNRTFNISMVRQVWKVAETYIKFHWLNKNSLLSQSKNVNSKKLDYDGYVPALNAGKKGKAMDTFLFIPEGLSAAKLIDDGLSSREVPDISFDFYGYYNIQGVPPNARRACERVTNPETGEEFTVGTDKLLENERFAVLVKIIGLDFHKKYETDEEVETLRYGGVILAVDQDEDGKGNIATLILNMFAVFWKGLIKRGFIKIMRTPIVTVRVRKGDKAYVKEFYTIPAYEDWKKEEYPNGLPPGSVTKYHKGLACNSKKEGIRVFKHFVQNITTFKWDSKADKHFDIYYGYDTSKRKKVLSVPVDWDVVDPNALIKKCTDVLNTDTRSYQQYNIGRKIPNIYDGLLDGRRKILACARHYFKSTSKISNVNSFGGAVKEAYDYQHGESSLNGSIVKMGQDFTGSMVIPLLKGSTISSFGSRKRGGKDAGDARYISTKLNHGPANLLFPPADDYLLQESESGEPKYFVPIQPYAIIQGDMHIPAHGWKVKLFAVCPLACIALTRKVINGEVDINDHDDIPMLPVSTVRWKGKIVCYRGILYSVGKYKWDPDTNTITITELPHGVFSNAYAFGDRKKEQKRRAKWKTKQLSIKHENEESHKQSLQKQQLKEFRRGLKSKKHGKEYDNTRNDTDTDGEGEGSDDDSDDGKRKGGKGDRHKHRDDEYRSRTIKDKPFVEHVIDRSEDDNICIEITLTDDGYDRIIKEYELAQMEDANDTDEDEDNETDEENERTVKYAGRNVRIPPGTKTIERFDPIEEYFLLRRSLTHQLNFLDQNKVVKHFNTYEEVFAEWYLMRKKLYEQRVEREIILLKYSIIELENIIKYSEKFSKLYMDGKDEEEVNKILSDNQLVKLNNKLLHNPKYTRVDELERGIIDPEQVSYNYLTHMRFVDTQAGPLARNKDKLERLQEEYKLKLEDCKDNNGLFTGAKTWLNELSQLKEVLENGFNDGWDYDEPEEIYESDVENSKSKKKSKSKSKAKKKSDDDDDTPKKKSKPKAKAKTKSTKTKTTKTKSKSTKTKKSSK